MTALVVAVTLFAIVFSVGLLLHGNARGEQGPYIERLAQGKDGVY